MDIDSKSESELLYQPPKVKKGQYSTVPSTEDEKVPQKHRPLCGCFRWFMEKPFERKAFALWLCFGIFTIALILIFFAMGEEGGSIVVAVFVCIISLYGCANFRVLLNLKAKVDKYEELNKDFRLENIDLSNDIDSLEKSKNEFEKVQKDLIESNERLKDNLAKFRLLNENMRTVNVENMEGMQKVLNRSDNMLQKWKQTLERREIKILMKLYERVEMKDNEEDVTIEEFEDLVDLLPKKQKAMKEDLRNLFNEYAGEDQRLSVDEYREMIKQFVEKQMETDILFRQKTIQQVVSDTELELTEESFE